MNTAAQEPSTGVLTGRALLTCLWRTFLIGAAFNTRGMQNVGFVYAMEPGLRLIYPDQRERSAALKRYLRHYNCHPFWAPLVVGMFLTMEKRISTGAFPVQLLDNIKNATFNTLSAIGDSVFGGSVLVFWALSTCCMLAESMHAAALVWTLLWFVALQSFKVVSFFLAVREGMTVMQRFKGLDLINWGRKLKVVNGALLCGFLYLAWPEPFVEHAWGLWLAGLGVLGISVSRLHISREFLVIVAMMCYVAYPWLKQFFLQ